MEKYLSANNIKIPVLSEDSKEFVRYLEDKDVDEEFIHELKHDNIKVVYIDKSLKKLAYQTKEMLYDTLLFNRNVPLKPFSSRQRLILREHKSLGSLPAMLYVLQGLSCRYLQRPVQRYSYQCPQR